MPKIPLLGEVPKGGLVAGGLAAVGVGGYLWWKHQQNASAPAAGGEYGYGAYGYGSGESAQGYYGYGSGGSMGSGLVNPYPQGSEYGYGAFGYGYYNPYTGQYLGGGTGTGTGTGGGPTPTPQPTAPKTNLQWVNVASKAIGGHRATLLRYIGGIPLSHDQSIWVREAIGASGHPPVAAHSGYPPKWHTSPPARRPKAHR
jgi:hypothetical protein